MHRLSCFKAYDIRGKVPDELNDNIAYKLGRAFSHLFTPKKVAVGMDIRLSSRALSRAIIQGFLDSFVDVVDIGLCGTEQIYFAVPHFNVDGGIMITASHNPPEYNGIKLVRGQSIPISGDSGLRTLEELVAGDDLPPPGELLGTWEERYIMKEFVSHILSFIEPAALKPFRVVVNPGNGCAGPVLEELEKHLPVKFIRLNFEPDGSFPAGVPNPLLPENRKDTIEAIKSHGADLGVAWDGDYDRCFFFDEHGEFVEGYYIVGLLAEKLLQNHPGERIIHDPRLTWNTIEIVRKMNGIPIVSKTGHAFIKERMRSENALYGGEMSAHHYFRDNFYCDSGMIPFLLILSLLSEKSISLSGLVNGMKDRYPVSGEINFQISDPVATLRALEQRYSDGDRDYTDGLSVEYDTWRFNVRASNTEPLVRLNVETRGSRELLEEKTGELLSLLQSS